MPQVVRAADSAHSYSTWVGFVFIFNIIVGTGALTLPGVFAKAGWLLSLVVLIVLAVISYMTVTFIIETMACANAVKNWQDLQALSRGHNMECEGHDGLGDSSESLLPRVQQINISSSNTSETEPAEDRLECYPADVQHSTTVFYYNIKQKFELGEMSVLFFNDVGRILFYLCISIYLYGDLSIYSAAIAKSLRDVTCLRNSTVPINATLVGYAVIIYNSPDDQNVTNLCWDNHTITRLSVYRLYLIGFTVIFGVLSAFSVQKTKYLQILTVVFRWLAFSFMIAIAIKSLISKGAQGHPPPVNAYGLPALFGASVYSFMCHHSLPSLIAPIRNKLALNTIITYDFVLISTFYLLLAMTGVFAFASIEDLYTLNFAPTKTEDRSLNTELLLAIDYFLTLFPVFTLSTSFPIMAITLRNNLQTLFLDMSRFDSYNFFVRRILFPLCSVLPPFVITYFTQNLTSLVAFTGSYAGACIQYLIPISLVYFARRTCRELLGSGVINEFQSPFRSSNWLLFVLIWAVTCMCLVTVNFFY